MKVAPTEKKIVNTVYKISCVYMLFLFPIMQFVKCNIYDDYVHCHAAKLMSTCNVFHGYRNAFVGYQGYTYLY